MMYRAILFDLDDTLYDLRAYWTGRLQRALASITSSYPELEREAMVRAAIASRVYMDQFPDFLRRHNVQDEELISAAHDLFQRNWFEELVLAEDAIETFDRLRPRFRLGLITNGPSRTQRTKIERFGLADHMDILIVSEEAGVAKPDPAIFHLALDRLDVRPAEALFVGDSPEYDLKGAAAAGMPFIWINRRNDALPAGVPLPSATITRLAELPPLIEKLHL